MEEHGKLRCMRTGDVLSPKQGTIDPVGTQPEIMHSQRLAQWILCWVSTLKLTTEGLAKSVSVGMATISERTNCWHILFKSSSKILKEARTKSSFYPACRLHSDTVVWLAQSHPNCIVMWLRLPTVCMVHFTDIYFCAKRVHNMHLQLHTVHQDVPMYAYTC